MVSIGTTHIEGRLTGNDKSGKPVDGRGDTGRRGTVSGSNDLLGVEEVDTEETDRVEGNKDECEYDSNVGRDEIVIGDLGSTDGKAELEISMVPFRKQRKYDSPYRYSYQKQQSSEAFSFQPFQSRRTG